MIRDYPRFVEDMRGVEACGIEPRSRLTFLSGSVLSGETCALIGQSTSISMLRACQLTIIWAFNDRFLI